MSDEETPVELETWIDEKFTAPGLADKFDLEDRTYVCTDITWDREDDEVHVTYRNKDKPATPRTPAAILTYYDVPSMPENHPSKSKASDGTKNVINLSPPPPPGVHPSQFGHYVNNPGDELPPIRRRPIRDNPQA